MPRFFKLQLQRNCEYPELQNSSVIIQVTSDRYYISKLCVFRILEHGYLDGTTKFAILLIYAVRDVVLRGHYIVYSLVLFIEMFGNHF
jgi:hypothetical protein